jgi:predicted nucleic acid-binding protein
MALLNGDETWLERWRTWTEADAMILAPAHFPVEVANALLRGARLTAIDASARLERLWASGVETADRGLPGLLGAIELAERHRLTVYDALYLDLALDVDAELATLDRDLTAAAASEGVPVSSYATTPPPRPSADPRAPTGPSR